MREPVTLITTVKNEKESIDVFLQSIARQTRPPDAIIITDGGSTDGTVDRIRAYRDQSVLLLEKPCNISAGRNLAIAHAKDGIIAISDCGCVLQRDWLEKITAFDVQTDLIAGNYRPIIETFFDKCQYSVHGLYKSGNDINSFNISSRSIAFRRKVWEEVGGYPEWLDHSEDRYFHERILRSGYRARFAKDAVVEWRQRPRLAAVFRQFHLYTRGNGIAHMSSGKHLLRFATYGAGFALMALSTWHAWLLLPLLAGFAVYGAAPLSNFRRLNGRRLTLTALVCVPMLLVFVDLAKMSGYLRGLWEGRRSAMRDCRCRHGTTG
jgi:glycosyltransferase involved in cell wall biosynthesis